jgi:HK97 gp10 family phage protein
MADDVRVVPDEKAIKAFAGSPEMRAAVLAAANRVVPEARARAPHLTGAGAASIHAEAVLDDGEWTAHISWTRDTYYLRFHELGTRSLPAQPFLVPSFEGAQQ